MNGSVEFRAFATKYCDESLLTKLSKLRICYLDIEHAYLNDVFS